MENQTISSKTNRIVSKITLAITFLSLVFGFVFVAFSAFELSLIDTLTTFIVGPIRILLFIFCIGFILISLFYAVFRSKKEKLYAFLPLIINVLTFLLIAFVPFTDIWINFEFHKNYDAYNEVVYLIKKGDIKESNSITDLTKLPLKYRYLSRGGGEIMIDTTDGVYRVFFFVFRGVLDNISGFMYRSDDSPPAAHDSWAEWYQVIKFEDHWYFCASW